MARTGRPKTDLTGKKMPGTMLTVIKQAGYKGKAICWECRCDCGKITIVRGYVLRGRKTKSCGCWNLKAKKLPGNSASINYVFSQYKARCNKTGRSFDLTKEEFVELTSMNCFYCGLPPSTIGKPFHLKNISEAYIFNGLDRVNNLLGYTLGNCVACCEQCNRSKLDYSQVEFISWVKRAYKHMEGNHMYVIPTEIYLSPSEKAI